MTLKPEDAVAKPEIETELSAVERTKDLAEEFGEKNEKERPEEDEVRRHEAEKSFTEASSNDFTIESPGMLYAHWSSTVMIRKETLYNWGKVKEVDIETGKGKRMTCKAYPIDDLEIGVIQVPDKMQLKLGVEKGCTSKSSPQPSRSNHFKKSLVPNFSPKPKSMGWIFMMPWLATKSSLFVSEHNC
jgi:hypothetical protein